MKWSEFNTDKDYKESYMNYKEQIKEILLKTYKLTDIYYEKYKPFFVKIFDDYIELLKENNLEVFKNSEYCIIGQVEGKPVTYLETDQGDIDSTLYLGIYKNEYRDCAKLIITEDKKFEVFREFTGWLYVDEESGELRSYKDIDESEDFYKEQLKKIADKYNKLEKLFTIDNDDYRLIDLVLNIEVAYKDKVVGRYSNGRDAINKGIECFE